LEASVLTVNPRHFGSFVGEPSSLLANSVTATSFGETTESFDPFVKPLFAKGPPDKPQGT